MIRSERSVSMMKVSVNERRLRPIYQLVDVCNYKKAIQSADKLLKKQPDFHCVKVLKALALFRLGQQTEADRIVGAVSELFPCDDNCLQALTMYYKECDRLDDIARLYDGVVRLHCSQKPPASLDDTDEEFMSHNFMAHVRCRNYRRQHQLALHLYKSFHKTPYYLWAVMSLCLQAAYSTDSGDTDAGYNLLHSALADTTQDSGCTTQDSGDTTHFPPPHTSSSSAAVMLQLAERMLHKYTQQTPAATAAASVTCLQESECHLWLIVLEMQGKYTEALAALDTPLTRKLDIPLFVERLRIKYYRRLSQWTRLAEYSRQLLQSRTDQFFYYIQLLESLFNQLSSQKQRCHDDNGCHSDDGCHADEATRQLVRDTCTFLSEIDAQVVSACPQERSPRLARLALHTRLLAFDARLFNYSEYRRILLDYLKDFSHRNYCFSDLLVYLSPVPAEDQSFVLDYVFQLIDFDSGYCPVLITDLNRHILWCQLQYLFASSNSSDTTTVNTEQRCDKNSPEVSIKSTEVGEPNKTAISCTKSFSGTDGNISDTSHMLTTHLKVSGTESDANRPEMTCDVDRPEMAVSKPSVSTIMPSERCFQPIRFSLLHMYEVYKNSARFAEGLVSTDIRPNDFYIIQLVYMMFDRYTSNTCSVLSSQFLLQALMLLRRAIAHSSSNACFHILMINLYSIFGSVGNCDTYAGRLSVKTFQFDSLSYLIINPLIHFGLLSRAKCVLEQALDFFTSSIKAVVDSLITGYKVGSFRQLPDVYRFHCQLERSLVHYTCEVYLCCIDILDSTVQSAEHVVKRISKVKCLQDCLFARIEADVSKCGAFVNLPRLWDNVDHQLLPFLRPSHRDQCRKVFASVFRQNQVCLRVRAHFLWIVYKLFGEPHTARDERQNTKCEHTLGTLSATFTSACRQTLEGGVPATHSSSTAHISGMALSYELLDDPEGYVLAHLALIDATVSYVVSQLTSSTVEVGADALSVCPASHLCDSIATVCDVIERSTAESSDECAGQLQQKLARLAYSRFSLASVRLLLLALCQHNDAICRAAHNGALPAVAATRCQSNRQQTSNSCAGSQNVTSKQKSHMHKTVRCGVGSLGRCLLRCCDRVTACIEQYSMRVVELAHETPTSTHLCFSADERVCEVSAIRCGCYEAIDASRVFVRKCFQEFIDNLLLML